MLEGIKESREEIQAEIDIEEREKRDLEEQVRLISVRLQELQESL